jgi:hypothetical protein
LKFEYPELEFVTYERKKKYKMRHNMGKEQGYFYPAVFEKEPDGYSLYFPDIEEAYTSGDNKKELFRNAREVLELSIQGRIEG